MTSSILLSPIRIYLTSTLSWISWFWYQVHAPAGPFAASVTFRTILQNSCFARLICTLLCMILKYERRQEMRNICPDLSTSGGLEWQWHYSTSSREGRIENLIILLSLLFRIFTLRMIEIWCTKVHRDITISCFILR